MNIIYRLSFLPFIFFFLFSFVGEYLFVNHYLPTKKEDTILFNSQYYQLKSELIKYELISKNGGWGTLPYNKKNINFSPNNLIYKSVLKRLEREGYSMDLAYSKVLKFFQTSNGLVANGNLDYNTILAMNIPSEKRVQQIKINMERWKTIPRFLGMHYIFVNVADFKLTVFKDDSSIISMKTIVGRTYRKTPIFSSKVTHIVFNPSWNIPPTVLKKDILPIALKDPAYLMKKNIRIYKMEKKGKRLEIHPNEIDWKRMSINHFPYELIQDPGPENSLGAIKFVFNNRYKVYMHDTPAKELFEKSQLTFSSGCIRLSKAIDLAIHLLENEKDWKQHNIDSAIESGMTITARIKNPVNIYIEYFTAWVAKDGSMQFRKDVYKRDDYTFK